MNIELPTGKTLSISVYEFLFILKDEDVDAFYQQCIAEDLGMMVENPFSNKGNSAAIKEEEVQEIPDAPIEEQDIQD